MIWSVSNIAWAFDDRLQAYATLAEQEFGGLEIAPGLFFADAEDPFEPTPNQYDRALGEIAEAGLSLVSMQSLLFGVDGAALFEDDTALQRLETGMQRAIRLAGRLRVPNLVFGSPRQRVVPEGMSGPEALDRAAAVFARLGDIAQAEGTVIAMEANPAIYGTNFLTHGEQALAFARAVGHPAVRFVLDIGAMHINEVFEQTPRLIADARDLLSHVHFSEPQLAPAPADAAAAATVLRALDAAGYDRAVSIEMKAIPDTPIETMAAAVGRLDQARQMAIARGTS
jgi:sugar phosphate isomerase/epimerase